MLSTGHLNIFFQSHTCGIGIELELQLPAYATATAMQDLSRICDLYNSPQRICVLKDKKASH